MFCGALNRIVRKKSKVACKLLVSKELDGGPYYWDLSLKACCCAACLDESRKRGGRHCQ